jgi:plastocyanin
MKTIIFGKVIIAIALIFSFAISSCKKDSSSSPSSNNTTGTKNGNEVSIINMAFSPTTLTTNAGTTVKWTNNDGVTHTVTSNTSVFDSGNLSNGKSYSFTFSAAGTYKYYCAIHPSMTGTIIVQ